jgi:photosystem II stability/assembly factor-like uncharacterized protein
MSDERDETRDPLEPELRSWFGARPTPSAPTTLRTFAGQLGRSTRPAARVHPNAFGWRQRPAMGLAGAAIALAIVVAGGFLVVTNDRGAVGPTSSPLASSQAVGTKPPTPTAIATSPSAPSPIDNGGFFGTSGLWAVVGNQLHLSTDGGDTWVQRSLAPSVALDATEGNDLSSVFVLDANHAWTASPGDGSTVPYGGQGPQFDHLHVVVSRTVDGGLTWQSVDLPGDHGGTQPVLTFADEEHGFLLLSGLRGGPASTVFASGDGGVTWQRVGGAEGLGSVFGASDATTLWAGNEGDAGPVGRAILDVSRDGGRTWVDAALPGLVGDMFVNDTLVGPPVFAGSDGAVAMIAGSTDNPADARFYRTSDAGRTWSLAARMPIGESGSAGVAVIDPEHYLVIDPMSGLRQVTSDGGTTWQQSASKGLSAALHVRFWDPLHGAAVVLTGHGGAHNTGLLRTGDGGQTWTPVLLKGAAATASPTLTPRCVRQGVTALRGVIETPLSGWFDHGDTPALHDFPNTSGRVYGPDGVAVPPNEGPSRLALYETFPANDAYFQSRIELSRSRGGTLVAVTVCGEGTDVWQDQATGELVLGWTDRNKSDVLIGNAADFTVQGLVDSAERVYDCCG